MAEPVISKIYNKIEEIRKKELKRAFGKMRDIDGNSKSIIDRFSQELVERMLQIPVEQLREAVLNNDDNLVNVAEKLFGLNEKKGE